MGKILSRIISQANMFVTKGALIIDDTDKLSLAQIIITQLLRGKYNREFSKEIYKAIFHQLVHEAENQIGSFSIEQRKKIYSLLYNENALKEISMGVVLNPKRIEEYSYTLCNRIFIFYRIDGDMEFVTSDNPVMFLNTETHNVQPFTNGMLNEKVLIYYPISPKILLCAYPKLLYSALLPHNDCLLSFTVKTNKDYINFINYKQMEQSYNQVYAHRSQELDKYSITINNRNS